MKTSLNDISIFIARVVFSILLMTHGLPKFNRLFEDKIRFGDPIGLGKELSLYLTVFSELIVPFFIIIGYKTRLLSLFPIVTMFVAAFIVHSADPFIKMEPAILFLTGFTIILISGPGKISLDYFFSKKKYY
ncbi:MAG: DoxX family protein [Flavobacteriaceae bacterium]|nr:DoxX family protein [Flavobacteriaceae bacterium]